MTVVAFALLKMVGHQTQSFLLWHRGFFCQMDGPPCFITPTFDGVCVHSHDMDMN